MELREKMNVILHWKLATNKDYVSILQRVILFLFSCLWFWQIVFEFVYSLESYHKNKKGEHFIETQRSIKS